MPRKTCPRRISFLPDVTYFKPAGVTMAVLEEVALGHDEVEAIRLKHLAKMDQEAAAKQMGMSQPTFHRLLSSAHEKLAEAVVMGKALRIEGGNVTVQEGFQGSACGRARDCGRVLKRVAETKSKNNFAQQGGSMKIAVTSNDGTLEGAVDERFGRCKKLVVYDPETKTVEVVDNKANMGIAQGAGIQTAQNVANAGAKSVISGHFGPKAFQVLKAAGIEIYTAANVTVAEALKRFEQGQLGKLGGADVDSHW
jgi:predicted DNA-binding protein (UPF0251 family)/predicted Fe-Mo cluster-binding NifX family protein